MTRRRYYIVVTIVFCLLAFTASASAECAWVFWQHREDAPRSDRFTWHVLHAFSKEGDCHGAREFWSSGLKQDGFFRVTKEGWRVRYVCLPDTIDPRGPKGK